MSSGPCTIKTNKQTNKDPTIECSWEQSAFLSLSCLPFIHLHPDLIAGVKHLLLFSWRANCSTLAQKSQFLRTINKQLIVWVLSWLWVSFGVFIAKISKYSLMSSYIRQWKLNIVEAKCQRSKWFKQYSLVSGMVRGSICAWDRDYKDLFGLESSWGSNINGKCDICFTTRKWHHHSRDFITFSRSWPKTAATSHSSEILGLTLSMPPVLHPLMMVVCCLSFSLKGGILVLMQCNIIMSVRSKLSLWLLGGGGNHCNQRSAWICSIFTGKVKILQNPL